MTDTDGILDRCAECGERAEFIVGISAGPAGFVPYHVKCSECANSIDYTWTKFDAMVEWNNEQRAKKAIKTRKAVVFDGERHGDMTQRPTDPTGTLEARLSARPICRCWWCKVMRTIGGWCK